MSVYFCSDFHLGHKNIGNFRDDIIATCQQNTDLMQVLWDKRIHKNDLVYCLGDMAFDQAGLDLLGSWRGRKILVKGNHDDFVSTEAQSKVFEEIHGMLKYKGFWLTHCPIHPQEMRGRRANLHGHTHNHIITRKNWRGAEIPDKRYFNCCVDVLFPKYKDVFVSLEEVRRIYGV